MREGKHVVDACHGLSLVTPRSYVSSPVPRYDRHYKDDQCQKTNELTLFFLPVNRNAISCGCRKERSGEIKEKKKNDLRSNSQRLMAVNKRMIARGQSKMRHLLVRVISSFFQFFYSSEFYASFQLGRR